jgi:hypothetical protein
MFMKKLLLSLLILVCHSSFAQHEADNWRFGVNAGIDFNTGTPVASSGALNTTEGCSSISDSTGNLLFYTDGVSVWNRNNQVMPNGTGLLGGTSSTQSALVVPKPGSSTEYYIFTVDEIGGPNGFEYSIVDMSLDTGRGDVTVKNVLILNNVTEKLTAVEQRVAGNYWIAVHEWGTDAFYVYPLTPAGIQTPVISHTGIVHSNANIQFTYGQMKFNTCGTMIGVAVGYQDTVEVFDFNNGSGIISNPFTLPIGAHVYGLEFSDNGSKLYVSTYDPLGTVVQFDLSVLQTDSILASKTPLTVQEDMYGLQLGIDGRIYAVHSWSSMLATVELPNLAGSFCNFNLFGFDLDPNFNGVSAALGTPGFVTSFMRKTGCNVTGIDIQENTGDFSIYPNPFHKSATIHFDNISEVNVVLKLYNAVGSLIREEKISTADTYEFTQKDLAAGVYFLKAERANATHIQKLIVE